MRPVSASPAALSHGTCTGHAWDTCSAPVCTGLRGRGNGAREALEGEVLEADVGLVHNNIHQAGAEIFRGVGAAGAFADSALLEGQPSMLTFRLGHSELHNNW